jgi:glycosyltransferase involved in cell wall biosynthesis
MSSATVSSNQPEGDLRSRIGRLRATARSIALALLRRALTVPSGAPDWSTVHRPRLLALAPVRNEMRYLPGFVANVAPQVDGIVALDDGSTDGSAEYLEEQPAVLAVVRVPPARPHWDEPANWRRLVEVAREHQPEWIVAIDADERLERDFRRRAARVIRRGRLLGFEAYAVRLRELWGDREHYRCDGLWAKKRPPRLFRARPDHDFDTRPVHPVRVPLQSRRLGGWPVANLEVYHLRMIDAVDRVARQRRYRELDPDRRWQPIGYDYLLDERGLRRRRVAPRRHFVEAAG